MALFILNGNLKRPGGWYRSDASGSLNLINQRTKQYLEKEKS